MELIGCALGTEMFEVLRSVRPVRRIPLYRRVARTSLAAPPGTTVDGD